VITRCLSCHLVFPANSTLEHLPRGQRFAFDPEQGRLWAICPACLRWTLAPIEERWHAVEELERLSSNARVLSTTSNIARLRSGDLELVRVGNAARQEEAWWRYGRELVGRYRQQAWWAAAAGIAVGAAFLTGVGGGLAALSMGAAYPLGQRLRRNSRFGSIAWRGSARCETCYTVLDAVPFRVTDMLMAVPGAEHALELRVRCDRCRDTSEDAGHRLAGVNAEHLLRRVLAYRHYRGASARRVADATHLIDNIGSAADVVRQLAKKRIPLRAVPETYSYALEMAVNDETERVLLQLDAADVEARWREEEIIAAISDGELTELPILDRMRESQGADVSKTPGTDAES
jgi:hypothetical protein